MTDPDFPEIIITRKRKRFRQAIDPCLGYYEPNPPDNAEPLLPHFPVSKPLLPVTAHPKPTWISFQQVVPCESSHNAALPMGECKNSIHGAAGPDSDNRVSSPPPLTVEGFLKRPNKLIRHKYRRQRRIVLVDSDDHAADPLRGPPRVTSENRTSPKARAHGNKRKKGRLNDHDDHDDSDYQPTSSQCSPPSPQDTPPRRRVPLKKRLLTAAVLSDVVPIDTLITGHAKGNEGSHRKPLRFQRQRSESPSPKNRPWSLRDPRKTNPFLGVAFVTKAPQTRPDPRPCKPVTTWVTPCQDLPLPLPHLSPKELKPKRLISHCTERSLSRCPPLTFIPLSKAEESYPSSRRRVRAATHPSIPPLAFEPAS